MLVMLSWLKTGWPLMEQNMIPEVTPKCAKMAGAGWPMDCLHKGSKETQAILKFEAKGSIGIKIKVNSDQSHGSQWAIGDIQLREGDVKVH